MKQDTFKKGDKIIFDSNFGYEIGFFIEESENMYNSYRVELVSGRHTGTGLFSRSNIKPYSKDLVAELTKKYCYEKDWSEVF